MPLPNTLMPMVTKLQMWTRLDDADRDAVLALPHRIRALRAHEFIVRDGDEPRHSCLILSGYAIRVRHPEGAVYTFWDYTAGCWQRDAGFRIDHLLLSPQAADRLLDAGVDKEYRGREKASDHAPTWVMLED